MGIRWKLREFEPGDEMGILNLRKITFGNEELDKQELEYWNWEFRDNYAGQAKIFLADDNGRIVGHYAVIPSVYKVGNKVGIIGSIVVDVMTHPNYRFQGMFTKLGKYSLDRAGAEGIAFSTGFPVRDEVMPGHLKVNWKHVMDIPVLAVPLNFKEVSKKIVNFQILNSFAQLIGNPFYNTFINRLKMKTGSSEFEVIKVDKINREFDEFWGLIEEQYGTVQIRNFNFLNWRFFNNKYRNYEVYKLIDNAGMIGFIVLRLTNIFDLKCLTIVDIHVIKKRLEGIDVLLRYAYKRAVQENVDLIGCMITKNNPYYIRMLKLGFLKTPYHFGLITHVNNDQVTEEELNVPNKLFFTWADTDVI